MGEFTDTFTGKLRFIAACLLIVMSIVILPFLLDLLWINPPVQAADNHSSAAVKNSSVEDSPNLITRGIFKGADGLDQIAGSMEQKVSNGLHSAADSIGTAATTSGRFVANGVGSGFALMGDVTSSSLAFIGNTTSNVFSSIANTSIVSSVIRPADSDKRQVPVIDSQLAALYSAQTLSSSSELNKQETTPSASETVWPINGRVTTQFGVPHRPYQITHTGLDISSGQSSGITPVKAFRLGQVVNVVYSRIGLGNHLVIDHGRGISSVYAHLSSISVRIGQEVDTSTILGYEGSTGASTGTHLHFEIRLDGQPVDPRLYINGQP